jgi:hypothetical protein
MNKILSRCVIGLGFVCLMFSCCGLGLSAENEGAVLPEFSFAHFRAGPIAILAEANLENTLSVLVQWTPEWNFSPNWNLGIDLGIIPFTSLQPNNPIAWESQLLLGRQVIEGGWIELGGGTQALTNGQGAAPVITGTVYYRFPDVNLAVLDRAFFGYSGVLFPICRRSELGLASLFEPPHAEGLNARLRRESREPTGRAHRIPTSTRTIDLGRCGWCE